MISNPCPIQYIHSLFKEGNIKSAHPLNDIVVASKNLAPLAPYSIVCSREAMCMYLSHGGAYPLLHVLLPVSKSFKEKVLRILGNPLPPICTPVNSSDYAIMWYVYHTCGLLTNYIYI